MKLLSLDTHSPQLQAGKSCVRNQTQRSRCEVCVQACPIDAITLYQGKVHFDPAACITCGACQFACPTGAVEGLPLPQRYYRDNRLVMPLSVTAPSVDELLMWHAQYQIRSVEMDLALRPDWVIAIAALNLKLKQLKQPLWTITPEPTAAIDKLRRRWLQIGNNKSSLSSVTPGWQMRRMFFADVSEYQLILDQTQCFLCGACARLCPESAISLDNETMILNHTRCNGCGGCEDICFSHAIHVAKNHEHTLTVLAVNESSCSTCLRPFMTWSVKSKQCPVCQRHHYGMREA